jgi:hypothetical protein
MKDAPGVSAVEQLMVVAALVLGTGLALLPILAQVF